METKVRKKKTWIVGVRDLKYIDGTPYKNCNVCQKLLKSSSEFFRIQTRNKIGFYATCKKCMAKTRVKPIIKHFNSIGDLLCVFCNKYKHPEMFNADKHYGLRHYKSNQCKSCKSIKSKSEYVNKLNSLSKEDTVNFFLNRIIVSVRRRAKCSNKNKFKDFNLSTDFLINLYKKQNGICALSGIKMTCIIGRGFQHYNISIDRIDSSKGYVMDNVQLVCSHVNAMKGNLTQDEFLKLCNIINIYNEK